MSKPFIYSTVCSHKDLNRLQSDIMAAVPEVNATLIIGANLVAQSDISLDQAKRDIIDATILAFVDIDPADKVPLIYSQTKAEASSKHFHNIDYKKELTSALIPKRTVIHGEVREVTWFRDMNISTPEVPVIKVTITYTRDAATALPLYRITNRQWYNVDGTLNEETKTTMKYYFVNPSDQIDEGYRRRGLLVKTIQLPVMSMMVEVLAPSGFDTSVILLKGRQFLDDYEEEFTRFIENSSTITDPSSPDFGKKTVIVKLEAESRIEVLQWMDAAPASLGGAVTIRQYLISEFNI